MLAAAIAERVTTKTGSGRALRALKGCFEDLGAELDRDVRFGPAAMVTSLRGSLTSLRGT